MSLETRKTVSLAFDNKSNLDYDSILNTCDDMRNSFAAGDIFASKSVPFLKSTPPLHKNGNWLYNGPRLVYNPETEILSLTNGRSLKKPSAANKAKAENLKITQAFELLATAKHSADTPKIFYEVANLYMDIAMYDRALKFYEKSTRIIPADKYVDVSLLPDTKEHRRKLERLGAKQKKEYLQLRKAKRENLLSFENNQRRMRALISHCHLFTIYLFELPEYDMGHMHMREAFNLCTTDKEHHTLLHYFHSYLMIFSTFGSQEIAVEHQILHSNGGPLAEAHMIILEELLDLEPKETHTPYLEWMGKRYAERSEFELSRGFFKRARDLNKDDLPKEVALTMWTMVGQPKRKKLAAVDAGTAPNQIQVRSGAVNGLYGGMGDTAVDVEDAVLLRDINKKPVVKFTKDVDVDEEYVTNRDDFTTYGKVHEESNTILYEIPVQGWQASTEAQLRRLQLLKQTYHMPPMSEEEERIDKKCLEHIKYAVK